MENIEFFVREKISQGYSPDQIKVALSQLGEDTKIIDKVTGQKQEPGSQAVTPEKKPAGNNQNTDKIQTDILVSEVGKRVYAFFIDMFVVLLIPVMTFVAIFLLRDISGPSNSMALPTLIIGLFLTLGYFPLLEYLSKGQTIGRKILGIRLVEYIETEGRIYPCPNYERISIFKLILRNFLKMCWYFPQPFYFLVVIYFVFFIQKDPLKRTFYDKMLKTLVIRD